LNLVIKKTEKWRKGFEEGKLCKQDKISDWAGLRMDY